MLSPLRMTILFSAIGLVIIGFSFFLMSTRIDLSSQMKNPLFFAELANSFLLAVSALALSAVLSRPGQESKIRSLEKITLVFLALVVIYDSLRIMKMNASQIHLGLNLTGIECFLSILGFSMMLGAAMLHWLRHGASVNPRLSGLVIGTACVALGNVSITFFCGIDNGMHILVWHFALPLIAAFGGGLIASRFLLKW